MTVLSPMMREQRFLCLLVPSITSFFHSSILSDGT